MSALHTFSKALTPMAGRDEQKIARARGGRDASSAFAEHVTARKRVPSAADTSPLPSTTTIAGLDYEVDSLYAGSLPPMEYLSVGSWRICESQIANTLRPYQPIRSAVVVSFVHGTLSAYARGWTHVRPTHLLTGKLRCHRYLRISM